MEVEVEGGGGGMNAAAAAESAGDGGDDGSRSRLRGPWSPEEDAILSEMVSKFGARNWSLISRAIPGRSGKSCRLRWCNQLDPALKRNPFSDAEDQAIIAAHAIHGNKWAIIAKLLPGRTDNAIKNHWNSTLRKGNFGILGPMSIDKTGGEISYRNESYARRKPSIGNHTNAIKYEDTKLDKNMVNLRAEQAVYNAQTVSLSSHTNALGSQDTKDNKNMENVQAGQDVYGVQPKDKLSESTKNPNVACSVARVGAFDVYNPSRSPTLFTPIRGPLVQAPTVELGNVNCFSSNCSDHVIPSKCGNGCSSLAKGSAKRSLLGPEFVDHLEPPSCASSELISISSDLTNITWIKSCLENSGRRVPENGIGQNLSLGEAKHTSLVDHRMQNGLPLLFLEGENRFGSMRPEVPSSQMRMQAFVLPTEV